MRFAQSSAVYFNYSLEHAIRDLARIGYDGIEIWGGRPHMYRHDLDDRRDRLAALIRETGLTVCNFIPAQFRYPSLLCSLNERVRRDSIGYIMDAMDNALAIGSPSVSLCPGMLPWDEDRGAGWRQLLRSFREIDEYGRQLDGKLLLLIEPAHRFETNLILTIEDTVRMLDELGSDRFGILLDTGHCNVNGEDFRKAVPLCKGFPLHVHFDDNRGDADSHLVPGEGNVDFEALAEALDGIGYRGFLSAELGGAYIMDPSAACERTLEFFRERFGGAAKR